MTSNNPGSSRLFTLLSWGLTLLIVAGLAAFAALRLGARTPAGPVYLPEPTSEQPGALPASGGPLALPGLAPAPGTAGLERAITLKTLIPERPRYEVVSRTVGRGDSVFGIAKEYNVTPETVLWANYDTLNDDPHSLRLGQVLNIPPTNGVFYQWQEGDTFEGVAEKFESDPEAIVTWPGNQIDLTNPAVPPGTWVMVPEGKREFKQWIVPTVARGSSGTSDVASSACTGGAVGSGAFIWPADNHYLSGNDYWSGHLGIDIAAGEGSPVYAADGGVVTMATGGWNYGYGNVVMIDHGNGYITLYAHLSQINVSECQSVYAGNQIARSGNTGNSFGAHLHFEVRLNGGFVNPWYVLPAP